MCMEKWRYSSTKMTVTFQMWEHLKYMSLFFWQFFPKDYKNVKQNQYTI